jgi:hypothetical protein
MLAHKGKAEVDFVGWNGGSKLTSGIHRLVGVLSFEGDTSAEPIDQNRASPKSALRCIRGPLGRGDTI